MGWCPCFLLTLGIGALRTGGASVTIGVYFDALYELNFHFKVI